MKKKVENPITFLVKAVVMTNDKPVPFSTKRKGYDVLLNKTEVNRFAKAADAAWDGVCDAVKRGEAVRFEVSTKTQELTFKTVKPYISFRADKCYYKIYLPEESPNFQFLERSFGELYIDEDISDIVEEFMNGDYSAALIRRAKIETEDVPNVDDNLFVVSDGKVWNVVRGENVKEDGFVNEYLKFEYKWQLAKSLEVSKVDESSAIVWELNTSGDIEIATSVSLEKIDMDTLMLLESLYRNGESNLPDKVFDDIRASMNVSEEELESGELGLGEVRVGDYPAEDKILSQEKVRDAAKLDNIVRKWGSKAVISWKYDGCAVRLWFKGIKFVRAETKGKARDVTLLMCNLWGSSAWTQGFSKDRIYGGYEFADKDWFITGEVVGRNVRRSVAAGYLLRKNQTDEETQEAAWGLKFIAYDSNVHEVVSWSKLQGNCNVFSTYSKMMNFIKDVLGIETVQIGEFVDGKSIADISKVGLKPAGEFDTDGIVIRVNDLEKYKSLGATNHHPKGSVAFKYEDVWYKTKVNKVYAKHGENGVVKLIAEFEEVTIDDKKVKSAVWQPVWDNSWALAGLYIENDNVYETCYKVKRRDCNGVWRYIQELLGDEIEVCLRGKVIPQWRPITEEPY